MDFLDRLFFHQWHRKLVSLLLAITIWLMVNQSMTTSKTFDNVPIRLVNVPAGMTVDGLLTSGILSRRLSLSLQGNSKLLNEVTSNDLEIVIDATDKSGEWIANITPKNLISLNPDLDLSKAVKKMVVQRLPISFTRLITEKIPVIVTHPIGEAPRDYQFLDVWPYQLYITVSGAEEKIKQVKAKGINLTFNLNNLSIKDLDESDKNSNEVSFIVPDEWKQVEIPTISELPLTIDDPQAQDLRLDFVKSDLHPINKPLSIALFFPTEYSMTLNPEAFSLALGSFIDQVRGLYLIKEPLFAKGVSRFFIDIVQDMLQVSVILHPNAPQLDWSVQFQNPRVLEENYVSSHLDPAVPKQREEYLRNRFRNYMNRFQLYTSQNKKLELSIVRHGKYIHVKDISHEQIFSRTH